MLNRRAFLGTGLSAGLVAWGAHPLFVSKTAAAAPPPRTSGARDTILVVVELTGGNDGLNTVVPFRDPEYVKLRPTLAIPQAQLRKINDDLGLHPALAEVVGLLDDRALCVVQGVGYPNPNQSHFRSMDIWQAGSTAETLTEGWLGKALKHLPGVGSFHLKVNNENAPLAYDGAPMRVPSITSLEQFQLQLSGAGGADRKAQRTIIEESVAPREAARRSPLLDFVQRTAANTYASTRRLQEVGRNYQPRVPYPATPLGNRLRLAAQLIEAGLGARVFYVTHGNFDTHATQAPAHLALLQQLSSAVTAFYKDLAARGHRDRVLIMTFSEFGRRARENGSRGTDHGSAAPMFLIGGRVRPGVVGAHPSLTRIPQGNLEHHTDFRSVYATVLEQWLGVESRRVLGEGFRPLEVLRA